MDLENIRRLWTLTPGDVTAETAAWDSEAEGYVFEEKNNFEDDPFLRFVAEKTALTKDMRTLDVGCGAGAYSVAMARRVGQADGVDLSTICASGSKTGTRATSRPCAAGTIWSLPTPPPPLRTTPRW